MCSYLFLFWFLMYIFNTVEHWLYNFLYKHFILLKEKSEGHYIFDLKIKSKDLRV